MDLNTKSFVFSLRSTDLITKTDLRLSINRCSNPLQPGLELQREELREVPRLMQVAAVHCEHTGTLSERSSAVLIEMCTLYIHSGA